MIAHIIPIRRLPPRLSTLTYAVPKDMQSKVAPGQLVRVPLRKSIFYGLVFSIEKKEGEQSKPISDIVHTTPIVTIAYLHLLKQLSNHYHTSISTLAKIGLLPLQKRKLQAISLSTLPPPPEVNKKPTITYLQYHTKQEHAKELTNRIQGTTLIIVPEIHRIDEVRQLLPIEQQQYLVVWHSQLTPKQQFDRWVMIRNQDKTIILGTRGAVFLPFPTLRTIIVDFEYDENHKHWDQNPRFHVKDVVPLLAQTTRADVYFMGITPSYDTYANIHNQTFKGSISWPAQQTKQPIEIISMKEERRAGRYGFMADSLKELITQSKDDICLFVNRTGFSSSPQCLTCGYVAICPTCTVPLTIHEQAKILSCHYCRKTTPLTRACLACHSPVLTYRGVGIEFVTTGIETMIKDSPSHTVCPIQSETEQPSPNTTLPRIVIGTQAAMRHVRWSHTSLIVYLDADRQLSIPDFQATEKLWYRIQEIQYYRHNNSRFFIQTFDPTHLLWQSLRQPERLYRSELSSRRTLGYPPYVHICRYLYGHHNKDEAQKTAVSQYRTLQSALTQAKKSITLSPPIASHPVYYRGQYWYIIIAKFTSTSWADDLIWLNQNVGPCKVDPHPISLLSP